jgi:hypothetical protein
MNQSHILSFKSHVLFFDIINIHIITLGSSLEKFIHHDFYLIYFTIKTYTFKHLGGSFSFECRIKIFFIFIHLQTTLTSTSYAKLNRTQVMVSIRSLSRAMLNIKSIFL